VFLRRDRDAARSFGIGQLPADELAFDEKLAVQRGQGRNVQIIQIGSELQLGQALTQTPFDLGLLMSAGPVSEWKRGQVAGEANAAGDDNVALGAGAAQPLPAILR